MKRVLTLAAIAVLALAVAAPAFARNGSDARVRVVHASPDAPNVDVIVNDAIEAFSNVPFTAVGDYAALPAGEYNVKVVPAGADAPVVIDENLNLFYNTDYTVIATGFLADIAPVVLVDDNRPLSVNKARVRFFHASPDAPAVDVAVTGGPVLFGDVEFTETGAYVTVPSGVYDLEVRLAGTDTVVLPLPGIMLRGGTVYTAYAVGSVAGGTLGAVLSEDAFSPARDNSRRTRGMAAESDDDAAEAVPAPLRRAGRR